MRQSGAALAGLQYPDHQGAEERLPRAYLALRDVAGPVDRGRQSDLREGSGTPGFNIGESQVCGRGTDYHLAIFGPAIGFAWRVAPGPSAQSTRAPLYR